MKKINVGLGNRSYQIFIESGLLGNLGKIISTHTDYKKGLLITDDKIWGLHGEKCFNRLMDNEYDISCMVIPSGERRKSLSWAKKIYDFMIEQKYDRSSFIIALGGGVIGDLSGFVAATFMRGIPFLQVPTTLLAQVDASIGGKVGVNLPQGKNLVGAFYQPLAVIIDYTVLETLPTKEMKCGMAEIIKYALIRNGGFLSFLENHYNDIYKFKRTYIENAIIHSCSIKADIVSKDEREAGLRAILNFGHTIGHAIETSGRYASIDHGKCVALGMIGAMKIAFKKKLVHKKLVERVETLIKKTRLPISYPLIKIDEVMKTMSIDKKVFKGSKRFVLLKDIGETVIVDDVSDKMLVEVLEELKNLG